MKSFQPGSDEEQAYFESDLCNECHVSDALGRNCEFVNHVDFCLDEGTNGYYECKRRDPPPWRHLCEDCEFSHLIQLGVCTFNSQIRVVNEGYQCFKKKKPEWRE